MARPSKHHTAGRRSPLTPLAADPLTATTGMSSIDRSALRRSSSEDRENRDPARTKGKRQATTLDEQQSLPTPTSDPQERVPKRRKMSNHNGGDVGMEASGDEDDDLSEPAPTPGELGEDDDDGDALEDVTEAHLANGRQSAVANPTNTQSRGLKSVYDPNQDETERRQIKKQSRALERNVMENRDELLKPDNDGIPKLIGKANDVFNGIKQTSDATSDAKLLVTLSDMNHHKATRLVLGDTASGIDVDEFVSKCITFMRQGRMDDNAATAANPTQSRSQNRRRRRTQDNDDDNNDGTADDDDTGLDWTRLATHACQPFNSRPSVSGFLLGPLSVQKRQRAPTQRTARQRADPNRPETQPENLGREDFGGGDNNNNNNDNNSTATVSQICGRIKQRLNAHCARAEAAVRAAATDHSTPAQLARLFRSERITPTGGPSLFDFVLHPTSFPQTVENLFYVSFLIKEGEVGVVVDDDGLPTLVPNGESVAQARSRLSSKHQAVFGLDFATWRELVDVFGVREGLIPHREGNADAVGLANGGRGWYGG